MIYKSDLMGLLYISNIVESSNSNYFNDNKLLLPPQTFSDMCSLMLVTLSMLVLVIIVCKSVTKHKI